MTFQKNVTMGTAIFILLAAILVVPTSVFAQDDAAEAKTETTETMTDVQATNAANVKMASFFAASFCVAISVFGAALAVSRIGTAAVGAVAEKPEISTSVLMYIALAEGLSIIGFLAAYLILNN